MYPNSTQHCSMSAECLNMQLYANMSHAWQQAVLCVRHFWNSSAPNDFVYAVLGPDFALRGIFHGGNFKERLTMSLCYTVVSLQLLIMLGLLIFNSPSIFQWRLTVYCTVVFNISSHSCLQSVNLFLFILLKLLTAKTCFLITAVHFCSATFHL